MRYLVGSVVVQGIAAVTTATMILVTPSYSQVSAMVLAQVDQSNATGSTSPTKFDLSKLNGLCDYVFDRTRMPPGSSYRFEYERSINEAAGTSPAEPIEVQREKIQRLWNNHQESFRCISPTFDVSRGSVLKYAIRTGSFSFVNAVLARWELDLNHIDPSDGRTILDYTKRELDVNRGSSNEFQLQEFFNLMRAHGAKFAHEL